MKINNLFKRERRKGKNPYPKLAVSRLANTEHPSTHLGSSVSTLANNSIKPTIFSKHPTPLPVQDDDAVEQTSQLELRIKKTDYLLTPFKRGGICQIYRGTPLQADVPEIGVKMIQSRWRSNTQVRRQFSVESQIMRELNHPSLPSYLGRGVIGSNCYYAYEFIDGLQVINLSQRPDLFPKLLVKRLALDIAKQLFETLDVLQTHLNPVAHGDISSENIIIDHQHRVYLIDFGCAHYTHMPTLSAKRWVGKPSFISPEQARGLAWDHRSDLYQAGILYYELMSGTRWNPGTDRASKHHYAAHASVPTLDFIADQVPIPLSMVFSKILHPDPDKRFQSAREVLNALNLAKHGCHTRL